MLKRKCVNRLPIKLDSEFIQSHSFTITSMVNFEYPKISETAKSPIRPQTNVAMYIFLMGSITLDIFFCTNCFDVFFVNVLFILRPYYLTEAEPKKTIIQSGS